MSEHGFLCGDDGCEAIEPTRPEVRSEVERRRRAWAREIRDREGEYPNMERQVDFIIEVTDEENEAFDRRAVLRIEAGGET